MRTSVVYIISNINKALAFEWIAEYLNNDKIKLTFILLNPGPSPLESFIQDKGIHVERIGYHGKKDIPKALVSIINYLRKEKPNAIHCHLFDASVVGLLAGRICGIKKNIYTRHHSSLHHIYFPRAVYYDKLINALATDIVAISGKVKEILIQQEKVNPEKVTLIPHGFKLEEFNEVSANRVEGLRNKYNPENIRPVIGAIARYTHWKGLQYTVSAIKMLLARYPDALLILANATGDYAGSIKKALSEIPARNYCEIEFEGDIMALYKLFDIYVHVPIDDHSEAFGQTYVEALAAGIPSVFTLSGIAREFIKDKENALVVDFHNTEDIYQAMLILMENEELRNKIIQNGRKQVLAQFGLKPFLGNLEALYLK